MGVHHDVSNPHDDWSILNNNQPIILARMPWPWRTSWAIATTTQQTQQCKDERDGCLIGLAIQTHWSVMFSTCSHVGGWKKSMYTAPLIYSRGFWRHLVLWFTTVLAMVNNSLVRRPKWSRCVRTSYWLACVRRCMLEDIVLIVLLQPTTYLPVNKLCS